MSEMDALWSYEKSNEMEQLGQKLLLTTLELEKLKSEAVEEISKNRDHIKQLMQLLKCALQERDEAKTQLHTLLNTTNSTITESSSHSDQGVVSSPDFLNAASTVPFEVDHASLVIDGLVIGRVLPQKGRFMQAVIRAGPLLQTLLVAGPLPRWRNPPQFQPFRIPPPLSVIRGRDQVEPGLTNVGQFGRRQAFPGMSNWASGLSSGPLVTSGMNCTVGTYAPLSKRQRFS